MNQNTEGKERASPILCQMYPLAATWKLGEGLSIFLIENTVALIQIASHNIFKVI